MWFYQAPTAAGADYLAARIECEPPGLGGQARKDAVPATALFRRPRGDDWQTPPSPAGVPGRVAVHQAPAFCSARSWTR